MKNRIFVIIVFFLAAIAGCKKDDDTIIAPPSITNFEVGANNNKLANPGYGVHLEGTILAEANIASVKLTISPKSGTGWNHSNTYAKYVGPKNVSFHEHLDIPSDTPLGDYQLLLEVTDQLGAKGEFKSDFKVQTEVPPSSGH